MVLKLIVFAGKMIGFICFYMFIRWTIPRFRFDQLMGLAWKVMMPLALLNIVVVLLVKQFRPLGEQSDWLLLPASLVILVLNDRGRRIVAVHAEAASRTPGVVVLTRPSVTAATVLHALTGR